ncbi:type II secretion system protein [Candidatus Kaiserbacteria bacterium]|nr:MAG: type II secretion system protein [Candidatus Kaiserbacteria bacterium]
MKQTFKRGFTLIELLVVIAIIGILASVVLASLNTARDKGADAAIKSNLKNAVAQAQVFYVSNSRNFFGVCGSGAGTIGNMIHDAENKYKGGQSTAFAIGTPATYTTAQCHDITNSGGVRSAWAAQVPLKGSTSGAPLTWCVDSTGASKATANLLASNATVCP